MVIDGVLVVVVSERLRGPVAAGRSDAELVVAARGDATAFLALYERYFPQVQRYVRIRSRSGRRVRTSRAMCF